VWEDRRNINGGSWTFRVPKANGPDFWTRVQLMAIGEKLQGCLDVGKLCSFLIILMRMENTTEVSCWKSNGVEEKAFKAYRGSSE